MWTIKSILFVRPKVTKHILDLYGLLHKIRIEAILSKNTYEKELNEYKCNQSYFEFIYVNDILTIQSYVFI